MKSDRFLDITTTLLVISVVAFLIRSYVMDSRVWKGPDLSISTYSDEDGDFFGLYNIKLELFAVIREYEIGNYERALEETYFLRGMILDGLRYEGISSSKRETLESCDELVALLQRFFRSGSYNESRMNDLIERCVDGL